MSLSASFQIPDLLNFCRSFDLRANCHCRAATIASEKWLSSDGLSNAFLASEECKTLQSTKIGLLASLCFPTCDAPQLRLITDFFSLLFCSHARVLRSRLGHDSGWSDNASSEATVNSVGCLNESGVFSHLCPRLVRLTSTTSSSWQARFLKSTTLFRNAELQVLSNRRMSVIPDVEEYIELKRDLSGLRMILDLIEPAEGLTLSEEDAERLAKLRLLAADIIFLSSDIFSYNIDQSVGNHHNIISVFMKYNGLSIQGAIKLAALTIKQSFDAFNAIERALLAQPCPSPRVSPLSSLLSTWNPISLLRSSNPVAPPAGDSSVPFDESDVRLYIQRLRGCIVGYLNWAYESELYFGTKGEEVRSFGWVFLLPKTGEKETEEVQT